MVWADFVRLGSLSPLPRLGFSRVKSFLLDEVAEGVFYPRYRFPLASVEHWHARPSCVLARLDVSTKVLEPRTPRRTVLSLPAPPKCYPGSLLLRSSVVEVGFGLGGLGPLPSA